MESFKTFLEAESEDHFAVSKYISTIARQVNPNDNKNWVTIHLKQSKGETKEFVVDYLIDADGKGVSTNAWNDINDKKSDRVITNHSRMKVRKMKNGWKVSDVQGDFSKNFKDNQKATSDEIISMLKDLPLGKD